MQSIALCGRPTGPRRLRGARERFALDWGPLHTRAGAPLGGSVGRSEAALGQPVWAAAPDRYLSVLRACRGRSARETLGVGLRLGLPALDCPRCERQRAPAARTR